MPSPTTATTLAAVLLMLTATCAVAQSPPPESPPPEPAGRPLWELGLAAGGGRVADYPGAGQTHSRGLVVPMLVYRGRVLRVDGSSIRGRVFDSPDWELDLSATGAFSARDNEMRRGMPGLDWLFGVGPQLVYKGWRRGELGPSLHLKTRALFSTDFDRIESRGASFDPDLRWRIASTALPRAAWTFSMQPSWASRALHRYFYQVDPAHATAARPAYAARAGYLGTEFAATLTRRESTRLSWFVTVRALSLNGAANVRSPLLRDTSKLNVGAGLIWTAWHSDTRVAE